MKACVLFEPGPAENLKIVEVRDPDPPRESDLLVRVEACGIDGHDVVTRSGLLGRGLHPSELLVRENGSWEKRFGTILGHEIAGTVVAVGPGVRETAVGDRITCNVRSTCRYCDLCRMGRSNSCRQARGVEGGYAELAIVPEGAALKIPDTVSSAEACIVSCAIGTPYRGITRAGQPRFTDRILVCGAGGGLGIHALQLLAQSGGFVMAVTTSPHKAPLLERYGAHAVICVNEGRFDRQVMELTDGHGADLILDTVGGTSFNGGGFRSLAQFGRYVFVGQINDEFARFAVPHLFWKEAQLTGTSTPDYLDMKQAMELVAARKVSPVVSEAFPLEETPRMHRLLEQKQVAGRAVITF
jgi:D-arabinose 1-dehydrogenase-like Zn-dependent alcohol dehydrogenase